MIEDTERIGIHRGLKGVYFDRSRVCFIDGRAGELVRGYSIHDLAERSTFEETCYLLFKGELPTSAQLEAFDAELKGARALPAAAYDVIRAVKGAHPMDVLRTEPCADDWAQCPRQDERGDSDPGRHPCALRNLRRPRQLGRAFCTLLWRPRGPWNSARRPDAFRMRYGGCLRLTAVRLWRATGSIDRDASRSRRRHPAISSPGGARPRPAGKA
jgi:Citrate synthase, C-terminal domain